MLKTIFLSACALLGVMGGAAEFQFKPQTSLSVWSDRPTLAASKITLKAEPEKAFSRGLIRFDLSGIPAADFARVERAELRFNMTATPAGLKDNVEMAPVSCAWNDAGNWTGSGLAPWPLDANQVSNVDNAAEAWRVIAPAHTGAVSVEVSAQVERWLYCGMPNNGWIFRVGPSIYGLPVVGPWEVQAEDFELQIVLSGTPPLSGSLQEHALRVYPSALLPPVSNPYIFHLFNGSPSGHVGGIVNSWNARWDQNPTGACAERGELPLSWCFGPQNPHLNSEQEFVDSYLTLSENALGIQVDEWQGVTRAGSEIADDADPNRAMDNKVAWSIKGILAAEKAHPKCLIAIYWRGEDSLKPLTAVGYPDLVILEAQSHLNKAFPLTWGASWDDVVARGKTARELGIIERTIPLFGFFENTENYHPEKILTIQEVETWIRQTRELYPEMPGFAFYGSPEVVNPDSEAAKLLAQAEALCHRYFVAPAPRVRMVAPRYQGEVSAPKVQLAAVAEAKEDRSIQRYDWFVDNCLIAQTSEPQLILDCRMLEPGNHLATVHAIDSQWNRAAAQIPFQINR